MIIQAAAYIANSKMLVAKLTILVSIFKGKEAFTCILMFSPILKRNFVVSPTLGGGINVQQTGRGHGCSFPFYKIQSVSYLLNLCIKILFLQYIYLAFKEQGDNCMILHSAKRFQTTYGYVLAVVKMTETANVSVWLLLLE